MKKLFWILQIVLVLGLTTGPQSFAGGGKGSYISDLRRIEAQKKEELKRVHETFKRHKEHEKIKECQDQCTRVSFLRYMIVEVLKYLRDNPYKLAVQWHQRYVKFVLESAASYNKYCKLTRFVKFIHWFANKLLIIFNLDRQFSDELYKSKKPLLPEKLLSIRNKILDIFIRWLDKKNSKLPEDCEPDDGDGTTPPDDDDDGTTPPDDGGSTTPPDDGGSTTPPGDGGSTTPPDDGGNTTPPDDSGSTTPPDDGGSTTPPDDGGSTTPPDDGGSTTPPDDGGSTTPPDDGGSTTPPDDGGSTTPPDDGGSTTPPGDGGSTIPPGDGGSTTPPGDGGSTTPPNTGGGQSCETSLPDFDPDAPCIR